MSEVENKIVANISILDTRLGWMAIAYEGSKLLANSIPFQDKRGAVEFLKRALFRRKIFDHAEVPPSEFISGEVSSAISGEGHSLELSFDGLSDFCVKVLKTVMKIPRGRVISYKALAESINSKAYRAVGNALSKNPFPIIVPCHRVVKCNGLLGGYLGGEKLKALLLRIEGVEIMDGKVMERHLLPLNGLIYRF